MRREQVFSKGGFYGFLVESNTLLHRQAMDRGVQCIQALQTQRQLRVLDLGCGGLPISIATMMEQCPRVLFDYTGVDINPDQVDIAANDFDFPANVVRKEIIEADAWNLDYLDAGKKFDIVYIGLNLHHGSPRECLHLMKQINLLLHDHGVFINHDSYRPGAAPYVPRPAYNPGNPSETLSLVSCDLLDSAAMTDSFVTETSVRDNDWRIPFTEKLGSVMRDRGGDAEGIRSVIKHILERDYSLSTEEMTGIARVAGLQTEVIQYVDSHEPMQDYYQMLIFRKIGEGNQSSS